MIIIERDALLSVLSRPPLHEECYDEEEYVLVSAPPKQSDPPLVRSLRESTSFDDCCSLASTSCSSQSEVSRGVSFSGSDEVHVVDRLYPKDGLGHYFYSCEDTQRYVVSLIAEKPTRRSEPIPSFCDFSSCLESRHCCCVNQGLGSFLPLKL